MRRDDNSAFIQDWSTKKLKQEFKGYWSAINELECFSTKDVTMLELIERELGRRNITPKTSVGF